MKKEEQQLVSQLIKLIYYGVNSVIFYQFIDYLQSFVITL